MFTASPLDAAPSETLAVLGASEEGLGGPPIISGLACSLHSAPLRTQFLGGLLSGPRGPALDTLCGSGPDSLWSSFLEGGDWGWGAGLWVT